MNDNHSNPPETPFKRRDDKTDVNTQEGALETVRGKMQAGSVILVNDRKSFSREVEDMAEPIETTRKSFVLATNNAKWLKTIAAAKGVSEAEIINRALADYAAQHGYKWQDRNDHGDVSRIARMRDLKQD